MNCHFSGTLQEPGSLLGLPFFPCHQPSKFLLTFQFPAHLSPPRDPSQISSPYTDLTPHTRQNPHFLPWSHATSLLVGMQAARVSPRARAPQSFLLTRLPKDHAKDILQRVLREEVIR